MGDVIDIGGKPRAGETAFPTCGCGETYTPLAIMSERPFIAALVCTECGNEVPVNNGYIGERGDSA
ncbi:hypothetical protein HZU72_17640 [Halomonas sp. QX-2]|uniref:Uncharacterized protein n=1 Tax=Vreelandella sedimenti TaxID=2729618 RepID=A0A7Z0N9R3_9GAMM|nr:hypothetical protein [Halomonas sedimenti]NYT74237.1 hypothetical protein [Halomonas sedimenti]|tara:strand:- start:15269 stop:15466 length:198 start_codon:yes stop_codon:yes gene_type:complete